MTSSEPYHEAPARNTVFSDTGNRGFPHDVYNDGRLCQETLLRALAWKCFFFNPKSFSATKVRARIVRWNRRGSTSHLFDPNPRQDHDYLFKLPNALGRQDAQPISRS
jgi:hypothetical protein